MKKNQCSFLAAGCLLAAATQIQAQTIADWTFDSDGLGVNSTPAAAFGTNSSTATATTVGFTTSLTTPPSIAAPDIINTVTGSSTPSTPDTWRIRGNGASPNNGNGWTPLAAIGTQGAEFTASTVGFNSIQLSFDVAPTTKGTGLLEVQYTLDDTASTIVWNNAVLTYAANSSLVLNNSTAASGGNGIVVGSYLNMIGAAQFYNSVTANFSSISGVANDANFAVEIVNAAEGTADLAANDAAVGTTGNWSLDNVDISGTPVATPEPGSLALAGLGLVGLIGLHRRKRKA